MRLHILGMTITAPRVRPRAAAAALAAADPGIAALLAAVALPPGDIPWSGDVALEGVETGDERIFAPGALTWADLPVPFTDGHDYDRLLGRVETLARQGSTIRGSGVFVDQEQTTPDGPRNLGRDAALEVAAGLRRGLSVDVDMVTGEIRIEEPTDPGGDTIDPDDAPPPEIVIPIGGDLMTITAGRIRGVALCTIAAFAETQLTLDVEVTQVDEAAAPGDGQPAPAVAAGAQDPSCGCATRLRPQHRVERQPMVAAALEVPVRPPASWFDDPALAEPTPVVVHNDGRVFGHLAGGECHIGYTDRCVRVASATSRDFSSFNDGDLETEDGTVVHVGQVTLVGGHADLSLSAREAVAHYDDTRSAVADVTVGWDRHNNLPWFAGALRPGVTDEQVRVLRASGVSGDWRPIGRGAQPQLIAVLSVNVPGFPVRRNEVRVASGHLQALVAAPVSSPPVSPVERRLDQAEREIAQLRSLCASLTPVATEQLRARIRAVS